MNMQDFIISIQKRGIMDLSSFLHQFTTMSNNTTKPKNSLNQKPKWKMFSLTTLLLTKENQDTAIKETDLRKSGKTICYHHNSWKKNNMKLLEIYFIKDMIPKLYPEVRKGLKLVLNHKHCNICKAKHSMVKLLAHLEEKEKGLIKILMRLSKIARVKLVWNCQKNCKRKI